MRSFQLTALALFLACLPACIEQAPEQPTEEDLTMIRQNLLKQAPSIQHRVDAELEGKAVYLGLDVDPQRIQPGQPFTLTHYWKCLQPIHDGWQTFTHIQGPNKQGFMNVDHIPIQGRYPVAQWKAGEIVRDVHKVTVPANWNYQAITVYTGLWRGNDRVKISKGPSDGENRVVAAVIPTGAQPPQPKRLIARKLDKPLKMDGKLGDPSWKLASASGQFTDSMTGDKLPQATAARVLWDDKNLYLGFEVEDRDLASTFSKRDDSLWTQDAVEIFLDPTGKQRDYFELQVSPAGVIFDSYLPTYRKNDNSWDSQAQVKVATQGTLNTKRDDVDKGYSVEVTVPWAAFKAKLPQLKAPPAPGDKWRFNMFRVDAPAKDPGKSPPAAAGAFSPPQVGDFHALDKFGELLFADVSGLLPATTGASAASSALVPPGVPPSGPAGASPLLARPSLQLPPHLQAQMARMRMSDGKDRLLLTPHGRSGGPTKLTLPQKGVTAAAPGAPGSKAAEPPKPAKAAKAP